MRSHPLSKSKLAAFAQCPKRLWLEVHRPELAASEDAREARLGTQEVFEEACRQCAGGVAVAGPDLAAALAATAVLVAAEAPHPIVGATLEHEGVWVRCDLLEPDGAGGWRLVAVTSSTRAKDHHRAGLATQLWVARGAGVAVSDATIRHLDPAFVLPREGDHSGVFADHDHDPADDLGDEVAAVPALVAGARTTLAGSEPDVAPGDHCSSPFECAFSDHCHAALPPGPEWPVEVLPRGGGAKWRAAGIADLLAVDPDQLGAAARRVHAATISGVPDHDPAGAAAAMAVWPFPRIWLDFETIQFPLPRWVGTRPYEQVPFQFTAIVEQEDGTEALHEFLHLDGTDPRRACAEALAALPGAGAAIAYHAPFERAVIARLAATFPDLAPALDSLNERLVDLLPVTRDHWYHRDQRGSWSIKAVLPTLSAVGYDALEVKHGADAQAAYLEAIGEGCTPARRGAIDAALRAYCGQDVEAMRVVARALVQGLSTNSREDVDDGYL